MTKHFTCCFNDRQTSAYFIHVTKCRYIEWHAKLKVSKCLYHIIILHRRPTCWASMIDKRAPISSTSPKAGTLRVELRSVHCPVFLVAQPFSRRGATAAACPTEPSWSMNVNKKESRSLRHLRLKLTERLSWYISQGCITSLMCIHCGSSSPSVSVCASEGLCV